MSSHERSDGGSPAVANFVDRDRCSIEAALTVVGDRWSLLVLREAFLGVRRFEQFRHHLQVPRSVLTGRLTLLIENGILRREPYRDSGQRERHEYRLTPKGMDLYPVLVALKAWGDQYGPAERRGAVSLTHRDCGAAVHLSLSCANGHTLTDARDVVPKPGV